MHIALLGTNKDLIRTWLLLMSTIQFLKATGGYYMFINSNKIAKHYHKKEAKNVIKVPLLASICMQLTFDLIIMIFVISYLAAEKTKGKKIEYYQNFFYLVAIVIRTLRNFYYRYFFMDDPL